VHTTPSEQLVAWTESETAGFGERVLVLPHRLHEREDLIGDAALVALLDLLPQGARHVYTMGTDPADRSGWRQGTVGSRSGTELLRAVQQGRLWFNLLRVQDHAPAWRAALENLVAGVTASLPGLEVVDASATLLVSSPTALVHYHADAQPNLLWHCRGRKRVHVWPALDPRFVPADDLSAIFAGQAHEWLPYDRSYDRQATVVDLEPGSVITWPQNAAHRVSNTEGVNVSLSMEFSTRASLRRQHVWAANRYLSTQLHLPVRSTRDGGPWAATKATSYRALRRMRPLPSGKDHTPTFQVDPDAPLGVGALR
jgi:hypothetical protein